MMPDQPNLPVGQHVLPVGEGEDERETDEDDHDRELDQYKGAIEIRRFAHADDEDGRNDDDGTHGEEVGVKGDRRAEQRDVPMGRWVERKRDAEETQEARNVAAPADRDGRRAESVFEHEGPADDPGHELAHGGVPVGIGAAGNGEHRSELRIAKAREDAADACDHERQNDGRTRELRRGCAGQNENSGADDGANAQSHQVNRAEGALQGVLAGLRRFRHDRTQRLLR
jgi:hypothetical protein